jgi:hypothetical protein
MSITTPSCQRSFPIHRESLLRLLRAGSRPVVAEADIEQFNRNFGLVHQLDELAKHRLLVRPTVRRGRGEPPVLTLQADDDFAFCTFARLEVDDVPPRRLYIAPQRTQIDLELRPLTEVHRTAGAFVGPRTCAEAIARRDDVRKVAQPAI